MVFKLVRTDTVEPCKIQLPLGKNLIGRGKLLECEDKRVSRNHGELEVVGDKVVIKALHQNPCFIIKKGTDETQILKQNCSLDISNGDKFGLLPDSYWYELLHCVNVDNEPDVSRSATDEANHENHDGTNSEATELMHGGDGDKNDNSQLLSLNLNDTQDNNGPDSPSLLGPENAQDTQRSPVNIPSEQNTANSNDNQDDDEQDTEEVNSPTKRSHSPDDETSDMVKKIKTESEIKPDPDFLQAGPSNDDQMGTNTDNKDTKPVQLVPNPALRERCMYGANCYRRNPQHKAQFSHPTDPDWGSGAQALCPRGAACRKLDPRHWRDHEHPPGVAQPAHQPPPPANLAGMRMVQRHGNTYYINAHTVNFYDDHLEAIDSDGDSVDYDYEF